ncbi:formylglycine-generating enzyme family protein [Bdellovibrio sp. ZAP7]|uniref:formylglycine-generating enzyme family protein n=1 Tax=Bdellovibrio sp. ZAP7 TaxID=2231053 RepID=UPI001157DB74|nr:formylglycine-generating enzyme family protein [Bdellovibrio sp. ZAP7]QDK44834.1 formylglycine-generating enzyme family protein [Bdellovibrio sp. ZAP7]
MGRSWKILISSLLISSFCSSVFANDSLIKIPAGEFKFPALLNKTSVKVAEFFLDKHAVTNAQYLAFVKSNPNWKKSQVKTIFADAEYLQYWPSDVSFGDSRLANAPVVRVSWFAARAYCESQGKRLPSLNEWEYVGLGTYKGQKTIQGTILEWYGKTSEWPLPQVAKNEANSYGLHDLHGLIWEWVEDFNSSLVTGESRADSALDKNLFCGAGASGAADPADYAAFMRYAFRSSLQAKYTIQNLGFRCAKDKE